MTITKKIPVGHSLKISTAGLQELCEFLSERFGEPEFSVSYADKTSGSFPTLDKLFSQGMSSLVIDRLVISAGDFLKDRITINLGNESWADLRVEDGTRLSEISDVLLRRFRGMQNTMTLLRGGVAKVLVTALLFMATYGGLVWLAVTKLGHARMLMSFEFIAIGVGIFIWNAYSRVLPWTEFDFSGVNAAARRRWGDRAENLIIGIMGGLIILGVSKYFGW